MSNLAVHQTKKENNPKENNPKENTQKCGICTRMVSENPRYPNYVCYNCEKESPPVNENNKRIEFSNADIGGGFISKVNGKYGDENICYIKNVKCIAREARFGGIVIQPA